jgi:hypothetical protein
MYLQLSLLKLAELIVHENDRRALHEVHENRRVFYDDSKRPLRLVEFVDRLRQAELSWQWCGGNVEVLDKAYDLTISKFSNLPPKHRGERGDFLKKERPDCRYYFKAFIKHVSAKGALETLESELQRERTSARLLQNLVIRHFYLSCLECRRSVQKLARRYVWKVNGDALPVWLPLDIPSKRSRAWLEANVVDVDPRRPGERERVQAIVDRLAIRRRILSLNAENGIEAVTRVECSSSSGEDGVSIEDLAEAVAGEKVRKIRSQRPAIQKLGASKLRHLILHVFDDLAAGSYEPGRIADKAGLSRATMSRFAGSRWSGRLGGTVQVTVPDLWSNTAKTLAADDRFMSVVQSAGLAGRIEKVLGPACTISGLVAYE